jgi:hypothetical protein
MKGKFRIKGIKSTNPIALGDWVDYELEETITLLSAIGSDEPIFDRIKIKIKVSDVDRVDSLIEQDNETTSVEHFLYTFSDEDLVDVIKNPKEWAQEETEVAQKIIIERGIDVNRNRRKKYNTITENSSSQINESEEISIQETVGTDNNKEDATNDTKKEAGPEAFLVMVGFFSIIYQLLKLAHGSSFLMIDSLMSPSSYYISELYGEAYGFLFSCFILILAAFAYIKQKWAVFFGLIIFIYDAYLFIKLDEWVFALIHGFMCINLLAVLNAPTVDEEAA